MPPGAPPSRGFAGLSLACGARAAAVARHCGVSRTLAAEARGTIHRRAAAPSTIAPSSNARVAAWQTRVAMPGLRP